VKSCSSCGLTNPDSSVRCDCGFSFAAGAGSAVASSATASSRPLSIGGGLALLGHAILWCAVVATALYAAWLLLTLTMPVSAVQQGAVSSVAVPPVVAYVLARGFDELAMRFVER
jgi:hypothetical protein